MGFQLPSPSSPREQTLALIARKDAIQAEMDAQFSILSANESTMNTPLVDEEGFPRADIDIWTVRHARVRIIMLKNDLDAVMNDIAKALEGVYDPNLRTSASTTASPPEEPVETTATPALKPFAKIDGVAPGSPAAVAGLQREDLLLKFGTLTHSSFTSSLVPLAELVSSHENRPLQVQVVRSSEQRLTLSLTPRKGWGGRGLLGCHLVPYSAPGSV